jgi:putative ABC transport system permease protein
MLTKSPGVTAVAVLTLALGIGANTAIFSVVHALLLKPLPFPEMERLVAIWDESARYSHNEVTVANYLDWKAQSQSFEHLGVYRWWSTNLTGVEPPERVQGFLVSASLLDALGMKPALGRSFRTEENEPGKDQVAILMHGLWQRRFGGDPNIVGQTITLNGVARTIIGVMPPEFNFPRGAEVLAPLAFTPELSRNRGNHAYLAVGRLKAGGSLEQAQADISTIARRLEQQYPETNTGLSAIVYPLLADTVRQYRAALLVLMGAVGFVLLIACANVANLMLARTTGRLREVAIRAALGAGRGRIVRQLMTESLVLAVLGGALGVLLAVWGLDLLKASLPDDALRFVPGLNKLGLNYPVLGFTLLVSVLTGMIFGLAPALQASKPNLNEALKEGGGGKSTAGLGRHRLRATLVVAEVALSLMLLVGAGLLMKSFLNLLNTSPGFNPENVLTMNLILPTAKYTNNQQRAAFYQELVERVKPLPGVDAVGLVNHLPLGGSNSSTSFLIEGVPEPPPGQQFSGRYRACTPDYFRALGITVLIGRAFTEQDRAASPPVVIVNDTLAKKFFPNGEAVGKRFRFTGPLAENPWRQIVGVIADVKHELNTPVQPEYYLPYAQDPWNAMVLVARTRSEPMALASAIQGQVRAIDNDQPVFGVKTMEQVRDDAVSLHSFSAILLGIFAGIALVLAVVGLYGVISYSVSQRTHEIGIRVALGAGRRDVLRLVVGQGMKLAVIGVVIGVVGSLALTQLMKSLLFEVNAGDPTTFVALPLMLLGVTLVACYVPARRATRVDPMVALRYE